MTADAVAASRAAAAAASKKTEKALASLSGAPAMVVHSTTRALAATATATTTTTATNDSSSKQSSTTGDTTTTTKVAPPLQTTYRSRQLRTTTTTTTTTPLASIPAHHNHHPQHRQQQHSHGHGHYHHSAAATPLKLLVCTANLGNEAPDTDSIAEWIPMDGCFQDVVDFERRRKRRLQQQQQQQQETTKVNGSKAKNQQPPQPQGTYPLKRFTDSCMYEKNDATATTDENVEQVLAPRKILVQENPLLPTLGAAGAGAVEVVAVMDTNNNNNNKDEPNSVRFAAAPRLVEVEDEEEEEESPHFGEVHAHGGERLIRNETELQEDQDEDMDQFDLIVIGMQEATFDPPKTREKKREKINTNNNNKQQQPQTNIPPSGTAAAEQQLQQQPQDGDVVSEHGAATSTVSESSSLSSSHEKSTRNATLKIQIPIVQPLVTKTLRKTIETVASLTASKDHTQTKSLKTAPAFANKRGAATPNADQDDGFAAASTTSLAGAAAGTTTTTGTSNEKSTTSSYAKAVGTLLSATAAATTRAALSTVNAAAAAATTTTTASFSLAEWTGGTEYLHRLFEARLPSYHRIVSYQRGQMRLEVFALKPEIIAMYKEASKQEQSLEQQVRQSTTTTSPAATMNPPAPTLTRAQVFRTRLRRRVAVTSVDVLHVRAQNTGRAGLANKGGIVTELLVNKSTRLAFVTAHLEAHEGMDKYNIRCNTIADILAGTTKADMDKMIRDEKQDKETTPTTAATAAGDGEKKPTSKRNATVTKSRNVLATVATNALAATKTKWHDVTLTSHYSFVMGDLNFRSDLRILREQQGGGGAANSTYSSNNNNSSIHNPPSQRSQNSNNRQNSNGDEGKDDAELSEEEHKQAVRQIVACRDWEALNRMDELHSALRNKHCLVGFQTLLCNFPPTFKLEREAGYEYVDKRRPSYTDRILWKTGHELDDGVIPLVYEPIDNFTTSDHKPVRAAFLVQLNEPYHMRPRAIRHSSVFGRNSLRLNKKSQERKKKKITNLQAFQRAARSIRKATSPKQQQQQQQHHQRAERRPAFNGGKLADRERLHLCVSNMRCDIYRKKETSEPPNPYICLVTTPEDAVKLQMSRRSQWRNRVLFKSLASSKDKEAAVKLATTASGWPRTKKRDQTFWPNWGGEEIECLVRTHHSDGSPMDLSGAMLRITVMDYTAFGEDDVIGTFCFNLVNLIRSCKVNSAAATKQVTVSGRTIDSLRSTGKSSANFSTRLLLGNLFRKSETNNNSHDDDEDNSNDNNNDPIQCVEIDEPILKNGREAGRLRCIVEAWWMDEVTSKSVVSQASPTLTRNKNPNNASLRNTRFFLSHEGNSPGDHDNDDSDNSDASGTLSDGVSASEPRTAFSSPKVFSV